MSATPRSTRTDPENGPLELDLAVSELELNGELRRRMPPDMQTVWDDFAPEGTIEPRPGEPGLEGEAAGSGEADRLRVGGASD